MVKRFTFLLIVALLAVAAGVCACAKRPAAGAREGGIQAAWLDYSLSEFDLAVEKFEAALASAAPGSDERLQALYGLATTWNLRRPGEDLDKARGLYEQVLEEAPQHDVAAWSLLGLARTKHLVPVGEDPDYPAVYRAYQEVIDRFPGHLAAEEAFIYLQAALISTLKEKETRQALAALEGFVKDPSKKFIGPAYSLMAVSYQTLNMPEERLWAEQKSLETTEVDPTNPFTEFAWQYWNLATIAEFEVGDFDTARKYYRKLIEEYPTDIRMYGAKQALKRMDEVEAKIRSGG